MSSATSTPVPRGLPARIWLVIRPNGELHFMHKEPLEGMVAWAKGLPATIVEYPFGAVVHTLPHAPRTDSEEAVMRSMRVHKTSDCNV